MWSKIKPYVISIIIPLAVGGISALVTSGNMQVYENLIQPPLAPPGFIFPIVWSILFILMGIGSALVYVNRDRNPTAARDALYVYGLQLAVNFFWSIIFFNIQSYLFAFIWLVLLWFLIIIMIRNFKRVSPLAAYLQIPYLLWVTFAGYLNLMIYILNG